MQTDPRPFPLTDAERRREIFDLEFRLARGGLDRAEQEVLVERLIALRAVC